MKPLKILSFFALMGSIGATGHSGAQIPAPLPLSPLQAKAQNPAVLWEKSLGQGRSLVFTRHLSPVETPAAGESKPIKPSSSLALPHYYDFTIELRQGDLESRSLWTEHRREDNGLRLLDAVYEDDRLTFVVVSDLAGAEFLAASSYLIDLKKPTNLPLKWIGEKDKNTRAFVLDIGRSIPREMQIVVKSASLSKISPHTYRVVVTWNNDATAEWQVKQGIWTFVRPFTLPKPLSAAEIAAKEKEIQRGVWMQEYRRRREVFGLTQEKATLAVRARSGIKDWQPLVEPWDTPDLVAKKYWLTPTPAPTPTPKPEPPPAKEQ